MKKTAFFFMPLLLSMLSYAHERNPWRLVQEPSDTGHHIYGSVTSGCIAGAESLAGSRDFSVMRPSRNRYYAHPIMKEFITDFAQAYYRERHEYVLIGDASQPRGGPFGIPGAPSMHGSHQTGIDVDIWYDTSIDHLAEEDLEGKRASSLVDLDGEKMSAEWDLPRVSTLLRTAASFKNVERIFVHPAIKRELCAHSRGRWLRKIRPWFGHADHFHVRLTCPKNESCRSIGDTLPRGSGCDKSLQWWFGEDAKIKAKQRVPLFRMPHLPSACAKVLPQPLPGQ